MKQVLKEQVAANLLLINQDVECYFGEVLDNPFATTKRQSQAVTWIMQNEAYLKRVLKHITYAHIEGAYANPVDYNVNNIYDYMLDYYSVYAPAYSHNFKDSNNEKPITIKQYVVANLKYMVYHYRDEVESTKPKNYRLSYLLADADLDAYGTNIGIIGNSLQVEPVLQETQDYSEKTAESKGQALFNETTALFDRFTSSSNPVTGALEQKYAPFDHKKFIYIMFLDIVEDDLSNHNRNVARELHISTSLVDLIVKDLRTAFSVKDPTVIDLYQHISSLLKLGTREGFIPTLK